MTGTLAGFSLGIGLAGLAGFRAFFPLLIISLIARYSTVEFFRSPFLFLSYTGILVLLLFFLAFEMLTTRLPGNTGLPNLVVSIAKILSGALLFAAIFGSINVFWGLLIGGLLAGLGMTINSLLKPVLLNSLPANSSSLTTTIEDMIAFIGSVLIIIIPSVAILIMSYIIYLALKRFRKHKRIVDSKKVRVLR